MAEPPEAGPESWYVPQRGPMLAAAAVPLALMALLAVAGRFYEARLAPRRHAPVTFPAPGIESYVHDGMLDPDRARPGPAPDAALAAAKRAVVADGLPGWPAR